MDQDSDNFSIVIGDPRNVLGVLLNRDNEIRVQIFGVGADVAYLLTGIVDDIDLSEDGRLTLTGRDNSAIATDTMADAGKWTFVKPDRFIQRQAQDLKLTDKFSLMPTSTKKTVKTDGSETAWEFWYRLIRKEKQWLWFTSDGILTSHTLNYNMKPSYFFGTPPLNASSAESRRWMPVERISYKKSTQGRLGYVVVFFHQNSHPDSTPPPGTRGAIDDKTTREWLKRPLKFIEDRHAHTLSAAKKSAYEEIFESKVGALEIKITIPDLGVIIRANRMATLRVPEIDLHGDWFVVGSRIIADESGFVQEVRLREKGYAISKRVPDDPETTRPPGKSQDPEAKCEGLCTVIPRWCDEFYASAYHWRGNVPFDLFLSTLVAICHVETGGGFKNERSSITGNGGPVPGVKGVEWFEWDGKPKGGINTYAEWVLSFANEKGKASPAVQEDIAVGPMQLYTRDYKYKADQYPPNENNGIDELKGNRWLPKSNIWEAGRVLGVDKGGNREETLWAAVAGYGPADGGQYVEAVRRLVYNTYLPRIKEELTNCIETQAFEPTDKYKDPLRDADNIPNHLARIDMGVDYASEHGSVIYAIGPGKVVDSRTSNWLGNSNWANIGYRITEGPAKGLYVYVAEYITPLVRVGDKVDANTPIAKFSGTGSPGSFSGDGIEMGWADSDGQTPMASSQYATHGCKTAFGVNFNELMMALGHGSGRDDCGWGPRIQGDLPADWPKNWDKLV
jgi:hypothetical protein